MIKEVQARVPYYGGIKIDMAEEKIKSAESEVSLLCYLLALKHLEIFVVYSA